MAGDNRPLPAAQSMTCCPRVDVCLSKHTHNLSQSLSLYIFFSTSNLSLSKISAFSQFQKYRSTTDIHSDWNSVSSCSLKKLENISWQEKKWACFSRSDEKSWLYGEVRAYLLCKSNPSAKHVHAIHPTISTGGVWAVWGHLSHGDYRHYDNGYLPHCNGQTACMNLLSSPPSLRLLRLLLTCIAIWLLDPVIVPGQPSRSSVSTLVFAESSRISEVEGNICMLAWIVEEWGWLVMGWLTVVCVRACVCAGV